jgi:hypothetical protein
VSHHVGMRSGFFALSVLMWGCSAPPLPASEAATLKNFGPSYPQLVSEVAIGIWETEHYTVRARCRKFANSIEFSSYSEKTLIEICGRPVAACMAQYDDETGGKVALNNNAVGQSYSIRVHETLHVIVCCEGFCAKDGNAHNDRVWSHVPTDELPRVSRWKNR